MEVDVDEDGTGMAEAEMYDAAGGGDDDTAAYEELGRVGTVTLPPPSSLISCSSMICDRAVCG